jgi:hypothetical protein
VTNEEGTKRRRDEERERRKKTKDKSKKTKGAVGSLQLAEGKNEMKNLCK